MLLFSCRKQGTRLASAVAVFTLAMILVVTGCGHIKVQDFSVASDLKSENSPALPSASQKRNDALPEALFDPNPVVWQSNRAVYVGKSETMTAKSSASVRAALIAVPGSPANARQSLKPFEKDGVQYVQVFAFSEAKLDFEEEFSAASVTHSAYANIYEVAIPIVELQKVILDPRISLVRGAEKL